MKARAGPADTAAASGGLRRPSQPVPAFVRTALEARSLSDAFRARPPYQRNEYLGWINRAKRDETKAKRLAQMLDELERGDRYMKMEWHGPIRPDFPRGSRTPSKLTGTVVLRRTLIVDAIATAREVLPVFENAASVDLRPREAIDGAEAWRRGEIGIGEARALAVAAHAAARSVDDDAARAAARAAGHAVATAHMAAHARRAKEYAEAARRLTRLKVS